MNADLKSARQFFDACETGKGWNDGIALQQAGWA